MSVDSAKSLLDDLLRPLGFHKSRTTWNRRRNSFVDVINMQISKGVSLLTINAGVAYSHVYTECWGDPLPNFVQEPLCTVRIRIGQLLNGKDIWWNCDLDSAPDEIIENVRDYVLPFIEQMHSVDAMDRFLTKTRVTSLKYPLPIIYLAVLKHEQGKADEACTLLNDLLKRSVGEWKNRIHFTAVRLSCA